MIDQPAQWQRPKDHLATERCPIGPLQLHTWNHGHTECIWCGPNALAWKPGHWVRQDDGTTAWFVSAQAVHGEPA